MQQPSALIEERWYNAAVQNVMVGVDCSPRLRTALLDLLPKPKKTAGWPVGA
jgi:hypothetical protein